MERLATIYYADVGLYMLVNKVSRLFEPIHGSTTDIAGQDKANPLATILSAAMLLKYGPGEVAIAKRIELVVLDTLNRGFRMGGIYLVGNKLMGCKEVGEEVLKSVDMKTPASASSCELDEAPD